LGGKKLGPKGWWEKKKESFAKEKGETKKCIKRGEFEPGGTPGEKIPEPVSRKILKPPKGGCVSGKRRGGS